MLQGVEAVQITDNHLQWRQHGGHQRTGAHHFPGGRTIHAAHGPPGADSHDQEGRGQQGRGEHMGEAIGEGGVEDHLPPAFHEEHAILDPVARRGLHPGVEAENPEGGKRGAHGDQGSGNQVGTVGHPVLAEQHNAQERRFQEKRGQHFIPQQGAGNIPGALHKARPVGTELKAHGDAGHHPQGETQGKDLYPEKVGVFPGLVTGKGVSQPEIEQHPAQADGDSGKQDMETDIGRKLQPGQQERIELHGHTLPNQGLLMLFRLTHPCTTAR